MRINEDRLFPYPVLRHGNQNFTSSDFSVKTDYRHNNIEYEFQFDVELNESNLRKLINNGDALIVCHLECSKTKFRSLEILKTGVNKIKINVENVDGRLELVGLIIANKDIDEYKSQNFDAEYEENSFSIQKGSILGIADMPSVFIENKKENLSNLPSIFDISYTTEEKTMKLTLNEERIKIYLPLHEYRIRDAHKNSIHSRNIMNAMIVFPALVAVLNDLSHKDSIELYGNRRWFGVLKRKLKDRGYDLENCDLEDDRIFNIAQELLEPLFADAMDSLSYLEVTEE